MSTILNIYLTIVAMEIVHLFAKQNNRIVDMYICFSCFSFFVIVFVLKMFLVVYVLCEGTY